MNLRPSTNLVIPDHLMLPKKALKEGFMYLYGKGFTGSPIMFVTRLWASQFFPSITDDPKFGQSRSKAKIGDAFQQVTPAWYLRAKVEHEGDPHIRISVPVFSFNVDEPKSAFEFLHRQFVSNPRSGLPVAPTARQLHEIEALSDLCKRNPGEPVDLLFLPQQVFRNCPQLDTNAVAQLKKTLIAMRVQTKGSLAVVFLDLKISKEEAQQLTTTEWQQMRDIDIYPLLLEWVSTSFGERGVAPIASFPISKIAMTLPKTHANAARVNEHNLSIGPNGRPYYLPREISAAQTIEYEDLYLQAGTRPDGSYALTDINEGAQAMASATELKTKLPKSVPVLIDWVNNKYSYTDTHGLLKVHDLMRFRKAEVPHIRTLLDERPLTEETVKLFVNMAKSAGVFELEFNPNPTDLEDSKLPSMYRTAFRSARTPLDWFNVATVCYQSVTEVDYDDRVYFSEIRTNGFGPFRPLARFFKLIAKACLANLAAVYREYSVKTVMENLSWLVMIAEYTDNMDELRKEDTTIRAAAINQGVDPEWKLLPCPMLDSIKQIGLIPHQLKIRNILRDSPLFAILPVQAGGGKSLLLITDILYEILYYRANPYILVCLGHLIANYVNEVLYFTGGQMNVIPISGAAIREHGFERLQAILVAMPRNSVVVVDYDTLRYKQYAICYGTTPVLVYPVIDFLRQFNFGYVGLDESHKVKNDTARTKATMCLITDIPKIRLASGTMAHDSPSDIALQVAAMDPTLFGTRDEFNTKYGISVSAGRVMHWRPNAQEQIRAKIMSRVVVAGAMRKEWAAFLPTKREWIGGVRLTTNQQRVYDAILQETLDAIEEDAKHNKSLAHFLGRNALDEDGDDEDDVLDEDAGSDLAALLRPYLARLEQFLMAPGKDPLGGKLLEGEDLKSPKALAVLERIKLHLNGGKIRDSEGKAKVVGKFPGKVLIFTNNIVSAEEIWELAGQELRKCGLLYKAENKIEHCAQFEKMQRIEWMVGVEASMNEGLNFQVVGRTIRPEAVWNPGTLEQGNSRSNRPELKKIDKRREVYYDSLVVTRTIDITKTARLISKVIAVAKFENSENPAFQTIPDVPIIKMSLDSLKKFNTWEYVNKDQPGLAAYASALAVYEQVREKDYAEYKEAYIRRYGDRPHKTIIEIAETPKDAQILSLVPYAPGGGIPFAKATRIDEYLNLIEDEMLETDDDDETDFSPLAEKASALKGRYVHTEYGEGEIIRCNAKSKHVAVALSNGFTVRIRKSATFLLNDAIDGALRQQIASLIGMALREVEDVPALSYKLSREQSKTKKLVEMRKAMKEKRIRERQLRKDLTFDISLIVSNGYLGLQYRINGNQRAIQTLQALGFRTAPAYYAARVPTPLALARQRDVWASAGLTIDKVLRKEGSREWFAQLHSQLKSGLDDYQETVRGAARAKLPNFYKLKHTASNEKLVIKPYPIIENGNAYIALPKEGQSSTKRAMRNSTGALKWKEMPATLTAFGTVDEIRQISKKMKEAGVTIRNADALNHQFRELKALKVRVQK